MNKSLEYMRAILPEFDWEDTQRYDFFERAREVCSDDLVTSLVLVNLAEREENLAKYDVRPCETVYFPLKVRKNVAHNFDGYIHILFGRYGTLDFINRAWLKLVEEILCGRAHRLFQPKYDYFDKQLESGQWGLVYEVGDFVVTRKIKDRPDLVGVFLPLKMQLIEK